jgi:acyl dehydratase
MDNQPRQLQGLSYEDLYVGMSFRSPGRTITETDIVQFAGLTGDYSDLHMNDEYARNSQFGKRVAHGMLGLSYAHGLMWAGTRELRKCAIAFLGINEWSFKLPIFVGDTLSVDYQLMEIRDSKSNPQQAIGVFDVQVVNQRSETVQRGKKALLLSKIDLISPA